MINGFFRSSWRQSFVLIVSLFAPDVWGVTGDAFDYKGYFRTGVGSNFIGGGKQCFGQQGIPGNEFRLGNECTDYGEMYFAAHVVRPKEDNQTFFNTWVSFSYNPPGYTQYEAIDLTGNPVLSLIETYIEAGGFGNSPLVYWVGKRFYREPEMHMDDFFYFADSSGSGGGVQNIPLIGGHLDIALLTETGTVQLNSSRSRILMLDVRLFQVPISSVDDLNFWTTASFSSGGTDANGVHYDNATGNALGVKYHRKLEGGDNNLAVVYGRGLSQGLNLGGFLGGNSAPISGVSTQNSSWRIRAVEDLVVNFNSRWAVEVGAVYERWNTGAAQNGTTTWTSIGARPIYFINEYLSLALEVGGSSVTDPNGGPASQFIRTTFAPQISPKIDFFARPVLRAYVTNTWGRGGGFGLQGEVWF